MPLVTRKSLISLALLALAAVVLAGAFLWSGLYDIGADDHHTRPVYAALETLRERSILARARALTVPDLSDPALIREGAGNYDAMCSGCHLAPGMKPTELSTGLYPSPPKFANGQMNSPAHHFWVIKHGIKASGMPAWGKSMDDRYLWGMVAFTQQFKTMTAAQYTAQVTASPGHSHGGGETDVGTGDPHADHAETPRSSFEPVEDPMATPSETDHDAEPHQH